MRSVRPTYERTRRAVWCGAVALLFLGGVVHPLGGQCPSTTVPPAPEATEDDGASAREILERFVGAWGGPTEMTLDSTIVVAFWVEGDGGGEYHAVLEPDGQAELREGEPHRFTLGYRTRISDLRRLDQGALGAHTAMGAERAGDPVPLDPEFPDDLEWTRAWESFYRPFHFHFWTRSRPEIVRFGKGTTRELHGASTTLFWYSPGIRFGWFRLESGDHVNAEEDLQTNPFDSMFVVTRGALEARFDGRERTLSEGEAVFVPAGMSHEFWADEGQCAEGVLLMFGEKA